mmetsp:Transcript_1572/g.3165  ORF Transcript_1572/g.3165 Transcript_1572/m.3165 type:complete len:147 (+) Transcript_1572:604-1044(+)
MEALWILMYQANQACGAGEDAVDAVMKTLPGGGTDKRPLEEICNTVERAEKGSFDIFIGSLFLLVGEAIVGTYWMKYSTLAMVSPFFLDSYDSSYEETDDKPKPRRFKRNTVNPSDDVEEHQAMENGDTSAKAQHAIQVNSTLDSD